MRYLILCLALVGCAKDAAEEKSTVRVTGTAVTLPVGK